MNTLQQTTVNVTFQFSTDKEAELVTILQLVVTLAMMIWTVGGIATRFAYQTIYLIQDIFDLMNFIAKVITIHINAYAFGLGVRL